MMTPAFNISRPLEEVDVQSLRVANGRVEGNRVRAETPATTIGPTVSEEVEA
ncbi:MAG: hypothetical protein M3014_09975 [Chloroflexota bacterium]|nr:hypothetical protein [Chloroflexota bacterium]